MRTPQNSLWDLYNEGCGYSTGPPSLQTVSSTCWSDEDEFDRQWDDNSSLPELQSVSDSGSEWGHDEEVFSNLSDEQLTSNLEYDEEADRLAAVWNDASPYIDWHQDWRPSPDDEEPGAAADALVSGVSEQDDIDNPWLDTPHTNPRQFVKGSYPFSGDERWELLESAKGAQKYLDFAPAQKMMYLLEVSQPYPGDPVDVLKKQGARFLVYQISETDMVVMDNIFDTDEIIPIKMACRIGFDVGLWYSWLRCEHNGLPLTLPSTCSNVLVDDVWAWNACQVLEGGMIYDSSMLHARYYKKRFHVERTANGGAYKIQDYYWDLNVEVPTALLHNPKCDIVNWYLQHVHNDQGTINTPDPRNKEEDDFGLSILFGKTDPIDDKLVRNQSGPLTMLQIFGQQVKAGTYPSIQRNSAQTQDSSRKVPRPLVIVVQINGHPARALIDSGSLGDFVSSTLAQQLELKRKELRSPIPVQLAVQGSRSRINFGTIAELKYQSIHEQ